MESLICPSRTGMIQALLWIGIVLLLLLATIELMYPNGITEGFEGLVGLGDSPFWAKFIPRRGDVGDYLEEKGYVRDDRYFHGYADVQRLGSNQDYCRMVAKASDPTDLFLACALGGTDGLSSLKFRTPSTKSGNFDISRDDYMRRLESGREGYCRILKVSEGTFEVRCNEGNESEFGKKTVIDSNPPPDIQTLLLFYEGIMVWLRLRDDMVDYAKNVQLYKAGNITIEEMPPLPRLDAVARTLQFNGIDQYLRLGDNKDLEFETKVELRYMRAVSFWVYFDEFTNNAHIFDFGNGAGKDNVWCGIIGRGNENASSNTIRNLICGGQESTVPDAPSGAQPVQVVSPQTLMKTTSANVNEYTCPKPEVFGRILPPVQPTASAPNIATTADLAYEIWDHQQRKFRVQVKNIIPLRKWVHITITARNSDAFRPDIDVYADGILTHTEPEGWLPQSSTTTNNYIGKSNWSSVTSRYENADELFKGNLFDFRCYRTPLSEKKIAEIVKWGKPMLPLTTDA